MPHLKIFAPHWSDIQLGFKYGPRSAEPYNQQHMAKKAYGLRHANGYRYGSPFLVIEHLRFGNPSNVAGSRASTPTLRADYLFNRYVHNE